MTIQELEQNINLMSAAIKDAQEALNKYQKALAELKESKKEGKWKPKEGDSYCYRDYTEKIVTTTYMCFVDECRAKNMPIFKTKEECKRYWHFMDTVKEKSYEFSKEEWEDDNINKYIITYCNHIKDISVSYMNHYNTFGEIHFKTEEDAQYIIDNFKDELMEYFVER